MLELDVAVASALLLSLASAFLCIGYGWSRWNADDDGSPHGGSPSTSERADDTTSSGPVS